MSGRAIDAGRASSTRGADGPDVAREEHVLEAVTVEVADVAGPFTAGRRGRPGSRSPEPSWRTSHRWDVGWGRGRPAGCRLGRSPRCVERDGRDTSRSTGEVRHAGRPGRCSTRARRRPVRGRRRRCRHARRRRSRRRPARPVMRSWVIAHRRDGAVGAEVPHRVRSRGPVAVPEDVVMPLPSKSPTMGTYDRRLSSDLAVGAAGPRPPDDVPGDAGAVPEDVVVAVAVEVARPTGR